MRHGVEREADRVLHERVRGKDEVRRQRGAGGRDPDARQMDPASGSYVKCDLIARDLRPGRFRRTTRACGSMACAMSVPDTRRAYWRPPLLWRALQRLARIVTAMVAQLHVTGDVPDKLRQGPLILA